MSTRIVVVAFLVGLVGVGAAVFAYVRAPRLTPELRGLEVARELGCFGCHGPGGTGAIPNPLSDEETVPAWDGGTAMMYVQNEDEIREWILLGRPERLAHEHDHPHGSHSEEDSPFPINMPAFEGVVSGKRLDDLIAYYKAVAAFEDKPAPVREGYRVASRLGCFGCHGPGGRVGTKNPRSFKGYIPPWHGRDYGELVKNDDELRQWILEGRIERLESNPVARFFTKRQVIQMPAYEGLLEEGELEALVAYVQWLNGDG